VYVGNSEASTTVETKFWETRTAGWGMVMIAVAAVVVVAVAGPVVVVVVVVVGWSRECRRVLAALPTMSASSGLLKRSLTCRVM